MNKVMRKLVVIIGVLVVVFTVTASILIHEYLNREEIFYARAFSELEKNDVGDRVIEVDFDSGESARVILEHSCCTGAGFNAVAVKISNGQEYMADKNYCGRQGFVFSLNQKSVVSAAAFAEFLEHEGFGVRVGQSDLTKD